MRPPARRSGGIRLVPGAKVETEDGSQDSDDGSAFDVVDLDTQTKLRHATITGAHAPTAVNGRASSRR